MLKDKFPKLVGQIPGLLRVEIAIPPLGTSNCDIALYNELTDEEALAAYAVHPAHVDAAALIREYAAERRCADITAD